MVQKVVLSDSECILDLPEAFWGGLGKVDFWSFLAHPWSIFGPFWLHFASILSDGA